MVSDIKDRVYGLLVEGFSISKVAKLLGVSRQRVSVIAKKLVDEGFLYSVGSNPKLFKPTGKSLVSIDSVFSSLRCRVHNVCFSFSFISPPVDVKWDKEHSTDNGVFHFRLFYPFEDFGVVTFERIKSTKVDKLQVYLPEFWLSGEELSRFEEYVYSYSMQCVNWFMKRYHCSVEPIGLVGKPHFAFPGDVDAVVISKYGLFSLGDHIWFDSSCGVPEWETDVLDYAVIRASRPMFLLEED